MNPGAWRMLAAAAAVGAVTLTLTPARFAGLGVLLAVCGAAIWACVQGPKANGDANRQPWALLAGGVGALAVAELIQQLVRGPSAGWAVPVRAVAVMLMAMAVWLVLDEPRGLRRRGLIDPAILAIGAGAVSWIFILDPIAEQADLATADRIVALAVPVLDVALLAVALRFVFAGALGTLPGRLLAGGIGAILVGDTVNSVASIERLLGGGGSVRVFWVLGVGLLAAAAAHPFAESIGECHPDSDARINTKRLVALGLAAIAGPLALMVRSSLNTRFNIPVVVGGTVILVTLILLRMAGLVRVLARAAAAHAQANSREKILRRAAHALVAATDRQSIYATAADAALALVRDRERAEVRLFIGDETEMTLVAGRGPRSGGSARLDPASLPGWVMEYLKGADSVTITFGDPDLADPVAAAIGADGSHPACLLVPLVVDGEVAGILTVALERPSGESRRNALETVGSQAALAIETAGLTEHLHARAGEARFRSLIQNASDVIAVIEPGGMIRFITPSVTRMLGFEPAELEGVSVSTILHPDDARRGPDVLVDGKVVDWRLRRVEGGYRHAEVVVADLQDDPNVAGIVLTMRDVTERRELESRLAHQAFHDTLTGLANRALFEDRLGQALARRTRNPLTTVAVIFIDLDDFKSINDTMGHQAGDELLSAASRRLVGCLRPTDTAARLGGDEFAIAIEVDDFDADRAIAIVAERILDALRQPFMLDGTEVYTRGSLGIATTQDGEATVEELLRNADIAMYLAKQSGKGRFKRFEEGMHAPVLRRIELKSDLQGAIERGEFALEYQPIVRLDTGAVQGFEALVRWHHPVHGLIPPADFIGLAEEAGSIGALGEWILETAAREFCSWDSRPDMYLSVNLSGKQLHRGNLMETVERVIAETEMDPTRLLLELTESVLVDDTERAIARLEALKARGVRVAIDDFGTGFSALAYLRRLPVDVLKLASPFVQGLATGQEPLTETIVSLAATLDLTVIAEGIEEAQQAQTLTRLGCPFGQGYFFSRPLPATQAARLAAGGLLPAPVGAS